MATYVVLISLFLINAAVGEKSLEPTKKCVPTATIHGACHVCVCLMDGIYHCQGQPCRQDIGPNPKLHDCEPNALYREETTFCSCSATGHWRSINCKERLLRLPLKRDPMKNNLRTSITCKPKHLYITDCDVCYCDASGLISFNSCTSRSCPKRDKGDSCTPGNKSTSGECSTKGIIFLNMTLPSRQKLPQIKEGEKCIPGKLYMMSCNRCQCTPKSTLLCSKMACADPNFLKIKEKKLNLNGKPSLRASSSLPKLPKGKCVPGRIYKKGCKLCFCTSTKRPVCSQNAKGACTKLSDGRASPILSPLNVRPPFTREEMKTLQVLKSASQKCEAGKSYKVNCNNCVCTEKYNLLCTKDLCLSFDDINRVEADERSGKKCLGDSSIIESSAPCIQCKCVKSKTSCTKIENCVSETRMKLSKGSNDTLKMQIDPIKDQCTPGAIYTDNCNRCYCQPDGSLRCTQKTCLNYAQSKALDEQFQRLAQEGL